ncbi:hypothetical protein [Streptomyces griseosporeus]|uniref:hypothetical protein n=1 Tax=Streptomyces griseosporeus TaxID=1910 RepID=UPI0036F9321B
MNARTAACTALLALAVLTSGCSGSSGDSKAQAKPSKTATSKTPAKPAATPQPQLLQFGSGWHWSDTDEDGKPVSGTTTVLSYTQPAPGVDLPKEAADFPDPEWSVLEVKVCADRTSNTLQVSQAPWSLGFPDDTRLDAPGLSGSGVAKPEYAIDGARVKAGACLRGKITYSVARGTRPDRIVYAPSERDPIEWAVPKA